MKITLNHIKDKYLYIEVENNGKYRFTELFGSKYDIDNYDLDYTLSIYYSKHHNKNVISYDAIFRYFPLLTLYKNIYLNQTYFTIDQIRNLTKDDSYKCIYVCFNNKMYIVDNLSDIENHKFKSLLKYYFDKEINYGLINTINDDAWSIQYE